MGFCGCDPQHSDPTTLLLHFDALNVCDWLGIDQEMISLFVRDDNVDEGSGDHQRQLNRVHQIPSQCFFLGRGVCRFVGAFVI